MRLVGIFFSGLVLWFVSGAFTPVHAQIFLEFSWTLENVDYEGLLYAPQTRTPTMTVRVLGKERVLEALVLEKVELLQEENGTIRLQCRNPELLWGDSTRKHLPEAFTAHDEARGRVSNGRDEAFYEIGVIEPTNIESVMKKYLLEEIPQINHGGKNEKNVMKSVENVKSGNDL